MRIYASNQEMLLTDINDGRIFASKQDLDVPKEITLVIPNDDTLVTQSWFIGFLERYFELGINVSLESNNPANVDEFKTAVKRLIDNSRETRKINYLKEVRTKLSLGFADSDDYQALLKDPKDTECSIADFFEVRSNGKGSIKLENTVDDFFTITLNRSQLAAVMVNLIDLSLGE